MGEHIPLIKGWGGHDDLAQFSSSLRLGCLTALPITQNVCLLVCTLDARLYFLLISFVWSCPGLSAFIIKVYQMQPSRHLTRETSREVSHLQSCYHHRGS